MAIVTRLKAALEFVRFADPSIREAYVDAINELAMDMDELEFEVARSTKTVFDKLDAAISEFENAEKEEVAMPIVDHEVDAPVEIEIAGADDEVDPPQTVTLDDDDIEI